MKLVQNCAHKNITYSCHQKYIQDLTTESSELLTRLLDLYIIDPFSENTIEAGTSLNEHLQEERSQDWEEMFSGINLAHNSMKGYQTLSRSLVTKTNTIKEPV